MKVSILNVQVPFVRGGAEYLADSLGEKIRERGHRVDQLRIPFKWLPGGVDPRPYAGLPPAGAPDRRSGPGHRPEVPRLPGAVREQEGLAAAPAPPVLRPVGHAHRGFPDSPETCRIRAIVRAADNRCLSEVRGLYTNSPIVANRLRRFNGIEADGILYPPLLNPELSVAGRPATTSSTRAGSAA